VERTPSSYKDPSSSVFFDSSSGKYFRSIQLGPEVYNSLGVFPKIGEHKQANVFEVEKISFVNYHFEWTFEQFRDAALFYLALLKDLDKKGFALSDATPLNITYEGNGKFTFIDHGSLINKEEGQWTAFYQFLKEYVYPLIYLSDQPLRIPLSLLPIISSKDWFFNYKPSFGKRINPKYWLVKSSLNLSARKSLSDFDKKPAKAISNQYRYNLEFFTDYIRGIASPKLRNTRWGNYYSETVLTDGYVERKKEALLTLFNLIRYKVKLGLDIGGSDGEMAHHLVSNNEGLRFICLESDPNASVELYKRSQKTNLIPIYNSIYGLTPACGTSECIPSLTKRLSGEVDLVMGLGIIHHMMNEENLSHDNVLLYFKRLIKKDGFMLLEYVEPSDPRHKLIANPNYPYSKTILDWETAVSKSGVIIQKINVTDHRSLYLIKTSGNE
jgi:hypothetical protein